MNNDTLILDINEIPNTISYSDIIANYITNNSNSIYITGCDPYLEETNELQELKDNIEKEKQILKKLKQEVFILEANIMLLKHELQYKKRLK